MIYEVEVTAGGTQIWRYNGKIHRDGDKPAIVYYDGSTQYYKHGQLHRDGDEPAAIGTTGYRAYWKNDKLHRDDDKPARIWPDGRVEYYKNDVRYTPTPKAPCEGQEVEINGVKYKLTEA